ncbi:MAG: hypothetical protein HQL09_03850 [Nitrospirae bacterium]|nr:hypothetical protein [Nitrospirota bacterium]
MITHSQQLDKEGMAFVTSSDGLREKSDQPAGKKGLMSGRTALIVLGIFGFVLSFAFPYGMGLLVFAWVIALTGALCAVGIACFSLLKDLFGRTAAFGYAPTTAYMAGTKTKKRTKKESAVEDKKEKQ